MKLFTSESVTEGHPDKICDQISDAILDAILEKDKDARVACEVLVTTGLVVVAGEISTNCYVEIDKIVRDTIRGIGYDRAKYGFDCETCGVLVSLKAQSSDIAGGVNAALETRGTDEESTGAGDQGMVFGYACKQTPEYMPMPIYLSHKLAKRLTEVRKSGILDYLRPDGKTQVTVEYDGSTPIRVDTIVISTQHADNVPQEKICEDLINKVIKEVVPNNLLDEKTKYYINPSGRFVIGGPAGDAGLTGRKIIVDTYGGYASHGGGAFSGKDATKVDRSGAYMARHIAKNIVANDLADECQIEISYAIGMAEPISVLVDTKGTAKLTDNEILTIIKNNFDMTPDGIIKNFDLKRPIYKQTAAYGHFGRDDLDLPWEKIIELEI